MNKKIIFSIYLILLGCLYVMNQLHLILINGYINYAIGILLIVMLLTKVPFLSHNLSSSKDIVNCALRFSYCTLITATAYS